MAPPVGLPADLEALRLPAVGHGLELGSWWLPESLAAELGGLGDWEMKFLGRWIRCQRNVEENCQEWTIIFHFDR